MDHIAEQAIADAVREASDRLVAGVSGSHEVRDAAKFLNAVAVKVANAIKVGFDAYHKAHDEGDDR